MPYQVVGLADQFVNCIASDFGKLFVCGGDLAAKVGGGDQVVVVRVNLFFLSDRFVDSLGVSFLGSVFFSLFAFCPPFFLF